MNSNKKILVTGATGFVGSNLTRKLVKEGFIVAIIKRKNSNTNKINDILDKLKIYEINLTDTKKVNETILDFKPNIIFHLATNYSVENNIKEIQTMFNTNILGTINLLEAAKDANISLFVNTSSCFIYGESKTKLKEDIQLNPVDLYALSKLQSEKACDFYSKKYKLNIITLRLFSVYGPYDPQRRLNPTIISNLLDGISPRLTKGEQKWDFVYVDDVVNAYLSTISSHLDLSKHEIFNIGSGKSVSIKEIALKIKALLQSEIPLNLGRIPYRQNEIWFMCADISKAKEMLNWEPKTQILDTGLKKTIDWFKKYNKKI